MHIEVYFSLLVALIGAAIFLLSNRPRLGEIGKIMTFCGLLAFLLQLPTAHFGILAK